MDRTGRFLTTFAFMCGVVRAASAADIDFAPSLESARHNGDVEKPVVITFSAPWCGWCRKMAITTFPAPEVQAVADRFLWVKLDPADAPALAARYRVNGLPHTVVLNSADQLLGSQPGFMTPDGLVQFLDESVANPQPLDVLPEPLLTQLEHFDSAQDPARTVREAVALLSGEDRQQREQLLTAVAQAGPDIYPYLAALLEDDRLAVRAAAGGLLARLTQLDLPYDPFADQESRRRAADAWTNRLPLPHPADLPLSP